MRTGTLMALAALLLLIAAPMAGAEAPSPAGESGPPEVPEVPDARDVDRPGAGTGVSASTDDGAGEGPPQVVHTYEIRTEGEVRSDREGFASHVEETLGDPRGWALGGAVAFERVPGDAELEIVLASASAVDAADAGCSAEYSCHVDGTVYINDRNWREATAGWSDAGGDLATYRSYLVTHEVGHFLGFGHDECRGEGEPALVMQQQSMGLDGCEPGAWPAERERGALAERLDVEVRQAAVREATERGARDGARAAADGQTAPPQIPEVARP